MINWSKEIESLKSILNTPGATMETAAEKYGVTRQRIYQVCTQYDIATPEKKRKSFIRGKGHEVYWLNRLLCSKTIPKSERLELLEKLELPKVCPILGLELNYKSKGGPRVDNSPSLDRLNPLIGYKNGNLQVISWRANRIKNDSTPEELRKLADYMENISIPKYNPIEL